MNQELYAFWKYDLFPYVLGGEVNEIKDNMRVTIKGREGYIYSVFTILPREQGLLIQERLDKLEKSYDEKKELLNKYLKLVSEILPHN
jgi:hypothetical protein